VPSKVHETNPNRGFPSSSFKYTPLQHVRVLFVKFVQGLFSSAPTGAYHWVPDVNSTEIVITDENPIHCEVVGYRPAISFTRGPVQFYSLGMDDMLNYNSATGKKTKGVLVPGTMSVNCCSRNDLESENIAWIVAEHIWLLREILLKAGFFEIGRQPVIQAPTPAGSIVTNDEGEEWYCTAISCPFQFARTSSFTPLGEKVVEGIEFALSPERLNTFSGSHEGPAATTFERPLNVATCPPPSFAPLASDAHGATPDPAGTREVFLPKQPHPLNPAATVVVRTVRPYRPAIRPASINGAPIPIKDPCVTESNVTPLQVSEKVVV